jgi:hypothetical protein
LRPATLAHFVVAACVARFKRSVMADRVRWPPLAAGNRGLPGAEAIRETDADAECEFRYQPDGWSKPYRFVALRYEKTRAEREAEETEQYQLFDTSQYKYRVFVTDMPDPIYFVVWFYSQRGGAENLIKEANNDAGLAAHPSGRFDVNGNHFQLAMLAYNLNCWLMLFNREPQADATELKHTTLATARLRFLFVAAKIWRHAGRTGVSYSDHYEEKGVFERLMDRLERLCARDAASPALNGPRRACRAEASHFGAGRGGNGIWGGR